jgi:hypothetical protein
MRQDASNRSNQQHQQKSVCPSSSARMTRRDFAPTCVDPAGAACAQAEFMHMRIVDCAQRQASITPRGRTARACMVGRDRHDARRTMRTVGATIDATSHAAHCEGHSMDGRESLGSGSHVDTDGTTRRPSSAGADMHACGRTDGSVCGVELRAWMMRDCGVR